MLLHTLNSMFRKILKNDCIKVPTYTQIESGSSDTTQLIEIINMNRFKYFETCIYFTEWIIGIQLAWFNWF